jgi:hypothetical protein
MENYGDCIIYIARPYGYKRYIVEWKDGRSQMYSGLWYSKSKVRKLVEAQLDGTI